MKHGKDMEIIISIFVLISGALRNKLRIVPQFVAQ
jgi:hypothetical protein